MFIGRLILAIVSTALEEVAIFVIWRFLLPELGIRVPVAVLIAGLVAWAAFAMSLFMFTTSVLKKQATIGLPTMVGSRGRVARALAPDGLVRIRGELWGAISAEGRVNVGEQVEVVGEEGLKLFVRKIKST